MYRFWLILAFITVATAPLSRAQTPPGESLPTEQVTVTGTKQQDQIRSFVQSYSAPSPAIGKLARWRDPLCPIAAGMPAMLAATVIKRVREIAAMVGAPVGSSSCHGNIDIVFSNNPQILLDNVRTHHPVLLGYHDIAREEELATVRHTVQSWYATQTADLKGSRDVDDKQTHARSQFSIYLPFGYHGAVPVEFDVQARTGEVSGYHMNDGLHSELFHVIITVNAGKMTDGQIQGITDYVAMLALAQTTSFGTCADMPSIANIVTDNCPDKPDKITDSDLAYLRALYKTDTTRTLAEQRRDIAEAMDRDIGPH